MKELYRSKRIEVRSSYRFWEHPIRWFQERKMRRFLEEIANYEWDNGMEEEVMTMMRASILFGTTTPTEAQKKELGKYLRKPI